MRGIKPDLNLYMQQKEDTIKNLIVKIDDMKVHSTEALWAKTFKLKSLTDDKIFERGGVKYKEQN